MLGPQKKKTQAVGRKKREGPQGAGEADGERRASAGSQLTGTPGRPEEKRARNPKGTHGDKREKDRKTDVLKKKGRAGAWGG